MKRTLNFRDFLKENTFADPIVKPETKPIVKPGRPSPIRRDKPSVIPKPKASAEEIAEKFIELAINRKDIKIILKNKYK
jgi:hypothetical protein